MKELDPTSPGGMLGLDTGTTALLIAELLECSGGRLNQGQILDAVAEVSQLYVSAATLELWRSGAIKFGYSVSDEELILCDVNQMATEGFSERIILRGNES